MKITYKTLLLLFITLTINSCKKAPANRDIEGFWKLTEYITEADGEAHPCERIFYAIQLQIAELSDKSGKAPVLKGLYHYDETTNQVIIQDFYHKKGGEYLTPDEATLKNYGLNKPDMVFDVIKADGKHLVLKSDYSTLYLKRF